MYPEPKKITNLGDGALYIMAKPAGFENLEEDMAHLCKLEISHVVSLLELTEAHELGLGDERSIAERLGISFRQFPIQDRLVPTELATFASLVRESYLQVESGTHLVAHCRAGIGRSGLFTTSVLLRSGCEVAEAFDLVSSARGVKIPDTQEQIDWIYAHANSIAA